MIDKPAFFQSIRHTVFGGRLTQAQVAGILAIIDGFARLVPDGDPRWLAAMLATACHETGARMQPVRETFADSDDQAIERLEKAFAAGKLPWVSAPYWRRDGTGKAWFGRGLVQLTHRANYRRLGKAVGADLETRPDRALERTIAVDVLVTGMARGLFTGIGLADCFTATTSDWTGSRAIINGRESAEKVARLARAFHAGLNART